ncbi:MAG: hypothetical protein Q7T56_00665 [Nocardioidaceae bacterium]|nr:hypothetical protein [Nocardioidaceae bacterium]
MAELKVAPFPRHDTDGSTVTSQGQRLVTRAGDVENVNADLTSAHNTATEGVAGDLTALLHGRDEPAKQEALRLIQKLTSAGGALSVLGGQITEHDETLTGLENQIRQHEEREEQQETRSTLAPRADEADATLRGHAGQAQTALEDPLAPAVVQRLTSLGAMPATVMALYPQAGVTPAQQAEGLDAKIAAGEVPDFATMPDDEVDAYLADHPELAAAVAAMLTLPTPSPAVLALVKAQARAAAARTQDGLDDEPGQDALDKIDAGNTLLDAINQRLDAGEKLTPAEAAYIHQWTNALGAAGLAALPKAVSDSVYATHHGPSVQQADFDRYLRPVSDAILNYSNVDRHLPGAVDTDGNGIVSKAQMPLAVRELVEMRIGGHHERTDDEGFADQGYRYGNGESGSFSDITNLDRFNGWSQLMRSSTVDPGDAFAGDLAHQAIQAKQDMNAILGSASGLRHYWEGAPVQDDIDSEDDLRDLASRLHDRGASDLLSVVSRNEDASSNLLMDDTDRRALLGLNWGDGTGAGDVITHGTDRDPAEGGGTPAQARAALAVMEEIASDPRAYEDRTNEQVSDAVVDLGVRWVDTFGEQPGQTNGVRQDVEDVLGNRMKLNVSLDDDTQARFLRFVAGSGDGSDDSDPIRFQAASVNYGNQLVSGAIESGDATDLREALRWSGNAADRMHSANVDFAVDHYEDENDREAQRVVADNREAAANAAAAKFFTATGATITGAVFPPASPFLAVGTAGANTFAWDEVFPQETVPDFDAMNDEERARTVRDSYAQNDLAMDYRMATLAAGDHRDDPAFDRLYGPDGQLKPFDEVLEQNRQDPEYFRQTTALAEALVDDFQRAHPDEPDVDLDVLRRDRDVTGGSAFVDNDDPRASSSSDGWSNDDAIRRLLYGDNRAQLDEAWEGQYGYPTRFYPEEGSNRDPYPTNPDEIGD